jgi:plastocyanin
MKRFLGICALLVLLTAFVAACGSGSSTTPNNTAGLAAMSFSPSNITIQKGQSIILDNQTATVHIISNGTWNGNTPDPKTESGAPTVNNMMFNSANQTQTIGPFNTAGTYHYYCSVHPDMNLTVTVQ